MLSLESSRNGIELPSPEILFHQHKVLVVNKPGGLLTQGPPGIDSMELRIKRWRQSQGKPDRQYYLGVPHRLDRPASGVMIFATDKPTTNLLSRQFENRQVAKTYWALVEGLVEPDSGVWVDFMRKMPDQAKSEIVDEKTEGAQQAILRYNALSRTGPYTHLEITLETGRTHQIRLQAASRGNPIAGDELYRSGHEFGPTTVDLRQRWIALHARQVIFTHPITNETVDIAADPAEFWSKFI